MATARRLEPLCAADSLETASFVQFLQANYPRGRVFQRSPDQYLLVYPLLFHWTLVEGTIGDTFGYDDRWCYRNEALAIAALEEWASRQFLDEPIGWHRHPRSGRRRELGDPQKETIDA